MTQKENQNIYDERIPRIIHYCWFGGGAIPEEFQENIRSWKKLDGYRIVEWNETNCHFDENIFVKKAYEEKKWAFVCDFYRLKALYEYGGIYMDTDVRVYRDFGELRKLPMFINFIYDCSVGTAVIGTEAHNPIISDLIDMYMRTEFTTDALESQLVETKGKILINRFITNNFYFTHYLIHKYPTFLLNNKKQSFDYFTIFPKELFEIGSLIGRHYTIHFCSGTWKNKPLSTGKDRIKKILRTYFPWIFAKSQIVVRKIRYRKKNRDIPFYEYSKKQKRCKVRFLQ